MSNQLQKDLLPKGIINIITDYTHTLSYLDELKDKIRQIYTDLGLFDIDYESSYTCGAVRRGFNKFFLSSVSGKLRYNLYKEENKRKSVLGIKQNALFTRDYYTSDYFNPNFSSHYKSY